MQMWHVTVGPLCTEHLQWQMKVDLTSYLHSISSLLADKWAFWCWSSSISSWNGRRCRIGTFPVCEKGCSGFYMLMCQFPFGCIFQWRFVSIPKTFPSLSFHAVCTAQTSFHIISPTQPATNKVLCSVGFGFRLFVAFKESEKCLFDLHRSLLDGLFDLVPPALESCMKSPAGYFTRWHLIHSVIISEQVKSGMSFPESTSFSSAGLSNKHKIHDIR